MPTSSMTLSPDCCCFPADNADVNISDGGNNCGDHHKDHKSYQVPESRKPELGVVGNKYELLFLLLMELHKHNLQSLVSPIKVTWGKWHFKI